VLCELSLPIFSLRTVDTVKHSYVTSAVLPEHLLDNDRQNSRRRFQFSTIFLLFFFCFRTVESKNFSDSDRQYNCLIFLRNH